MVIPTLQQLPQPQNLEEEAEFKRVLRKSARRDFKKFGIETDPEQTKNGETLQRKEVRIKSELIRGREYKVQVRDGRFENALAEYERQERDAWAHGLRVLIGVALAP